MGVDDKIVFFFEELSAPRLKIGCTTISRIPQTINLKIGDRTLLVLIEIENPVMNFSGTPILASATSIVGEENKLSVSLSLIQLEHAKWITK